MSKTILNLLLIVVSVALYFVIISPIYSGGGSVYSVSPDNSIVQLTKFKNKNNEALTKLDTTITEIGYLKREYENISQKDLDTLDVMIPDSVDPVRLVSEVTKLVRERGLAIETISYAKDQGDQKLSGVGVYTVSLSVKCSYSDLKNLLEGFQTSKRLFTVQSVGFVSPEKSSDPMTVNIKMNTYYIK